MTKDEVMAQLEALGSEQTRKVLTKHGLPAGSFGVKVGDMKPIQKKIKKDHALSLALYATGNSDAMYFAGLIADEQNISKAELQLWAETATWYMISEYTVAWLAADSRFGWELALEWIESANPEIAAAGWQTISSLIGIKQDEELDIPHIEKLLDRVETTIHNAPNRVRYVMNNFVIAAGGGIASLTDKCIGIGERIGKVKVEMGGTACKVPVPQDYIRKMADKGRIGKRKKMARC